MRRFRLLRFFCYLIVGLVLPVTLACRSNEDRAPARTPDSAFRRPFFLGFSAVPYEPTENAYRQTFQQAADAGEVILIQRSPPWTEFLPGAKISEQTDRLTRLERDLARSRGLDIFLAIDPTDPGDRGNLVGLPEELRGKDFADSKVRAAFVAYAKYLALNYKPAYMALGVEVNMFFNQRGDGAFRSFQSLYFEAYDAVKEVSPHTLVFPTFQYEVLLGILNTGEKNPPTWGLISRFEPKIDLLAVSSFPGFVFKTASEMPVGYYGQLQGRSSHPIAFVSLGWGTSSSSPDPDLVLEGEQANFLRRAMAEAENLSARMVIWYLARDPVISPVSGFDPLRTSGLYRLDGRPKLAWMVWRFYSGQAPPGE